VTVLAPDLLARADAVELRAATARLLDHLFPHGAAAAHTDRSAFLTEILRQRPALRQAVLAGDDNATRWQWADAAGERRTDITFFHALAVLYRDQALAGKANPAGAESYWVVATALWTLLLSAERFWSTFWSGRESDQNPEELLDECLRSVLSVHGALGPRSLASGRLAQARVHLRCLDICCHGADTLVAELKRFGVAWDFRPDRERLGRAEEMARGLIDKWSKSLVRDGQRETEDPEALRHLPEGLRKNYEGGIKLLQRFIALGAPDIGALCSTLEWFNDWCYDLYVTENITQIKKLMVDARQVADQLVPRCAKLHSFRPENQALSRHFLLRGFLLDDPEKAIEQYEEALTWDDQNVNARQLMKGRERDVWMKQVKEAAEHASKKRWAEAYQILKKVQSEVSGNDADEVRRMRAVVTFNHAQALTEEGQYTLALEKAEEAARLDPDEPVVRTLARELKRMAHEEANIRVLRAARDALDADRFREAIERASEIPSSSSFYQQACDVRAAAHFYRGIEHANSRRLAEGIADLDAALQLVRDDEYRAHIAKQRDAMRQANVGNELGEALKAGNWSRADTLLRSILQDRSLSRETRRNLEGELSQVLTAWAVQMVNEAQEAEMKFGAALADVVARLKQRPEVR